MTQIDAHFAADEMNRLSVFQVNRPAAETTFEREIFFEFSKYSWWVA
jgi:hypothetical protein